MRLPRLFLDHPLATGNAIELRDEALHYVCHVLRLGEDAPLRVFNGDGNEYAASLSGTGKRAATIQIKNAIDNTPARRSPLPVHLGIGLSRGERMDWAVQKATELGVAAITPLTLERCNAKIDNQRGENRLRHWRQIAISACEQSGRRDIPRIALPESLEHWLARRADALGLVLHTSGSRPLATGPSPAAVFLLVGPEGGLAEGEFARAMAAGFLPWSLGPRVLRTETAPVAALAVLQFLWGDLRAVE
jgi:16S rRNA (uracil1498-N3)-methyltransferase